VGGDTSRGIGTGLEERTRRQPPWGFPHRSCKPLAFRGAPVPYPLDAFALDQTPNPLVFSSENLL